MANGLSISEFKTPSKYDRAELFIAKINETAKSENGKPNVLFKRRNKEEFFKIKIDSETGKEAWNKKPIAFKDVPDGRIYKRLDTGDLLLLSEIEKTAEFGSSSGSGTGSSDSISTTPQGNDSSTTVSSVDCTSKFIMSPSIQSSQKFELTFEESDL